MSGKPVIDNFIKECTQEIPKQTNEKFIGWETLVTILVIEGIKIILPEVKEWVKLGATVITMKRLELKKKLMEFAKEKELDYQEAEKAAAVISEKINEENLARIVNELEA